MERLNYDVLKKSGYDGYILENAPEKVLQFGEGNFLRAFVDYWFDLANEKADWNGKCVVIKPRAGASKTVQILNEQEGLYTLCLRGSMHGARVDERRVISSVSRCLNPYVKADYEAMMDVAAGDDLQIIVSNTTEAGIVYNPACLQDDRPPESFPAKLTQVLYHRFKANKPGVLILACELIDNNGKELLHCVEQYIDQWELGEKFKHYVNNECTFCGSLVDRIVPGGIRDEKEIRELEKKHGYADPLLDVGEVFGVWIIEGDEAVAKRLPFGRAGLGEQISVVPDMAPYKKRKVRILNGAHTGVVLGAYLAGKQIVRECMEDEVFRGFMNQMLYDEVLPTLPLAKKDLEDFAAAVQDRFHNPFIDHALLSISLNSTSKWRTRNLPSLLAYVKETGTLAPCLTMSLAAYIAFYSSDIQRLTADGLVCRRPAGDDYVVNDDRSILEFYEAHKNDSEETLVHHVLKNEAMWGQDLTRISGLEMAVTKDLGIIRREGARAAYASCLK